MAPSRHLLLALLLPAPARAQIVSPGPARVAVTLYRAPDRGGQPIAAADPQGFALVTETRTVTLPAGPATVRFEGVAGNILPESAVISGVPAGVTEKNLDADLLSPRTLYDRSLGRRVLIRRTNRKTGRVIEEQATLRSSAAGAAVLSLRGGIEGLRCSGLPETLVYPRVPAGLSPRPTLSIGTTSRRPVTATLTLTYLAGGFDWQADYVLAMRPDGHSADLTAWITLASSDVTSFPGAETAVVAGKVNHQPQEPRGRESGALALKCWPTQVTYGHHVALAEAEPAPPPPPVMAPAPMAAMDIVVTGAKRMARQEELGDLKLYRFPERVTVAAKAQKQVALLARAGVPIRPVYVGEVYDDDIDPLRLELRARNRAADRLGLPLPAGAVAVFQDVANRPVLLGTTTSEDKAVGEDLAYKLPAGPGVHAALATLARSRHGTRRRLTVTNANPWPIAFEARLRLDDDERLEAARLTRKDGRWLWSVDVPANGRAVLDYAVVARE